MHCYSKMSPHEEDKFFCICCCQDFKSERLRDRHFPVCFQKFSDAPRETRIPSDQVMCLYCGVEFRGEYELGQHSVMTHRTNTDVNSRCFLCGKNGFHSQLAMDRHRELHDRLKHLELTHTITCPTCDHTFETRILFQQHMHSAHIRGTNQNSERDVETPVSEISAGGNEADEIQNDEKTNTSKSLWKCPLCPNFVCEYGTQQHSHNVNLHKDRFKVSCRCCGLSYNSKGRLRTHEAHCTFRTALKRDRMGYEFSTVLGRVQSGPIRKTRMLR